MTPEEINEAVALKLGWEKVPGTVPVKHDLWIPKGKFGHGDARYSCPDYSGDIKLAWEIVEYLRKQEGYAFRLKSFTDGVYVSINAGGIEAKANDKTAAKAISLAFLKLPS
jgi:hypothetical protein